MNENQHFVPKFYLKNFAIKKKDNYYLNCFCKLDEKIFLTNINNMAHSKNFYGFKDISEGNTPNALKKIIQNESLGILSNEEKMSISIFASLLMVRTNHERMMIDQMLNGVMQRIIPHLNLSNNASDYIFNWTNEGFTSFIAKSVPELASVVYEMKWLLSVNNTDLPFWTSDSPICRENNCIPEQGFSNLGLRCRGIQVHLPISPILTLHFLDPERFFIPSNVSDFFDEEVVIHYNYLQVYNSVRYIFSANADFSLAKKVIEKLPDLRKGSGISMQVC
jgi:hypothetical protein